MNSSSDKPLTRIKALQRAVMFAVVLCLALTVPLTAGMMKVAPEQTFTSFKYPESVADDPEAEVLYVSEFGSQLKPTLKDGKGRISKVSLSGKVLAQIFLPASGATLNKPKGIWVKGKRLWVTDIDAVWIFDLNTKKGRKVDLPGIKFANDPTVIGNTLYVSDNRGDQLYSVEPSDFLEMNGDGVLLVTDWNSGSLFSWTAKTGMKTLASGFKGPADFCVYPNAGRLMVVVPDLVKSELRMVQIEK